MTNGVTVTEFDNLFKWKLTNPFHAWERLQNSLEYPRLTRWELEIVPLIRIFQYRNFLFSVKYDNTSEPGEITAKRLEIVIYWNDEKVNRHVIFDYPFSEETRYSYSFGVDIENYAEHNNDVLVIMMRFDLKRVGIDIARALGNDAAISLLHGGESADMSSLTGVLWNSQYFGNYCTMYLFASDNRRYSSLHCMLQVRWDNLFKLHNLDENSTSLHTGISPLVLSSILQYVYTGKVDTNTNFWSDGPFATEFFQVVFRYQIFHLYGTLRQSHLNVSQDSINYVDIRRISVVLHYIERTLLRQQSMIFPVYVYPHTIDPSESGVHTLQFSVHVKHENRAGPWLSYSLLSQTETQFNVHVDLELPGEGGLTRLVHSSDYTIPRRGRVSSGPILFLGCPETFYRHFAYLGDNEIYKRLLFGLTFKNCASSISVWQLSNSGEVTRESLDVFSQHMGDVLRRQFKADLVVQPRGNRSGYVVESHRIHKAIFNARVPTWFNVVQPNLQRGAVLPDTVVLLLSNESYHLVASYMYTGKTFYVPVGLRREILNFGRNGGFESLCDLVRSMNVEE